jgi:VWFA-related protein
MKRFASFFCLAVICLSFTLNFAQSRTVTPTTTDSKKKNRRPVETQTPAADKVESETIDESLESEEDAVKVDSGIVSIPVKVMDGKGRFVPGLTKENFKVYDNGEEQAIEYFSNEAQPFTVALVLDMSYSAKFKAEEIQAAALAFINQLRPDDKVMIVSFAKDVYINCEPTSDRKRLQDAIKQTKIDFGTSVYDALDLVLNKRLNNITGRKAIVLFSDGVDTTSERVFQNRNLVDALASDALIYPIQYDTFMEVQAMKNKPIIQQPKTPSPIPGKDKSPFPFPVPMSGGVGTMDAKGTTAGEYEKADQYLNELANRTGGRLYKAATITNLSDAFSRIARELREYYSIGYAPKGETTVGAKHKIEVRVDREDVKVKARDSYVVGESQKESEK